MKYFLLALASLLMLQAHAIESNLDSDDPYEILGVDPTAPDQALTDAWRTLLKTYHPDQGGNEADARNIIEAYQFLKANRIDYNRRFIPFRGVFKKRETRPVPLSYEEILKYQIYFLSWVRSEEKARKLAGPNPDNHPVFIMYAMMNLRGDHRDYTRFQPWQRRAYRELLTYLDLLSLTKSELAGIVLNDPVEALEKLLEHYDNFNVRRSTLTDLFMAYNQFYLSDEQNSSAFLGLIGEMEHNHRLYEIRFRFARELAVESLRKWVVEFYYALPKADRARLKDHYIAARHLIFKLEPMSSYLADCSRLLLGLGLK